MAQSELKVATCQFAVGRSIEKNARQICELLRKAKKLQADIAHFPECALSGYAGIDFPNFEDFDWELLKQQSLRITSLAAELKIWVILGSTHRLTWPNKPHNSLYLIGPDGKIKDRYDKRFCLKSELRRYTPGDHFVIFTINGVRCSLLICFDARFPELYRELYKQKVKCIFQSFYNARQKGPSIHTHIMRQTMQTRAASNAFWVSMSNSCGYYSPYPSCFIRPDGKIERQLKQNRPGIMVNTVDINAKFYDPMGSFRDLAVSGRLDNRGCEITDKRSSNRKIL